jgi:hypothetical protein
MNDEGHEISHDAWFGIKTAHRYLEIDGRPIPGTEMSHYTIRFVYRTEDGASSWGPVLYKDGRRVTKAWKVLMSVSVAADEATASANTAD